MLLDGLEPHAGASGTTTQIGGAPEPVEPAQREGLVRGHGVQEIQFRTRGLRNGQPAVERGVALVSEVGCDQDSFGVHHCLRPLTEQQPGRPPGSPSHCGSMTYTDRDRCVVFPFEMATSHWRNAGGRGGPGVRRRDSGSPVE